MFDPHHPALIRITSLFHVPLPFLMIYLVQRLGYDWRALPATTVLSWVVLPLTYVFTNPDRNINWVFGWGGHHEHVLPPWAHLGALMVMFPLIIYLPSHYLLKRWFVRRR